MAESTKTKHSSPVIWKYAVITILIFLIIFIGSYMIGLDATDKSTFFTILYIGLLALLLIFMHLELRRTVFEERYSFGNAWFSGFIMILIISIFYALFTFVFYNWIAPDKLAVLQANGENSIAQKGLTGSAYDTAMAWNKKIFSPAGLAIATFITYIFIGAILSLLVSPFVQRTK